MIGRKIDPADLVIMERFRFNETFYLKNEDGSYSSCLFTEDLVNHPDVDQIRTMTKKYMEEKRLFLNRNNPGGSFE